MATVLQEENQSLKQKTPKLDKKQETLNVPKGKEVSLGPGEAKPRIDTIRDDIKFLGGLDADKQAQQIQDQTTGPDTRNIVEKTLNLRKNQGVFFDLLEFFDRPDNAIRTATEWLLEGKNPIEGFAKGITGEAKVEWSDILNIDTEDSVKRFTVDIGMTFLSVFTLGFFARSSSVLGKLGAGKAMASVPDVIAKPAALLDRFSNSFARNTFGLFGFGIKKIAKPLNVAGKEARNVRMATNLRKAIYDGLPFEKWTPELRGFWSTKLESADITTLDSMAKKIATSKGKLALADKKRINKVLQQKTPEQGKEILERSIKEKAPKTFEDFQNLQIIFNENSKMYRFLQEFNPKLLLVFEKTIASFQRLWFKLKSVFKKNRTFVDLDKANREINNGAIKFAQTELIPGFYELFEQLILKPQPRARQAFVNMFYQNEAWKIRTIFAEADSYLNKGMELPIKIKDKLKNELLNFNNAMLFRADEIAANMRRQKLGKKNTVKGIKLLGDFALQSNILSASTFKSHAGAFFTFKYTTLPETIKKTPFFQNLENMVYSAVGRGKDKKFIYKDLDNMSKKIKALFDKRDVLIEKKVASVVAGTDKKQLAFSPQEEIKINENIQKLTIEYKELLNDAPFYIGKNIEGQGAVVSISRAAQVRVELFLENMVKDWNDAFYNFIRDKIKKFIKNPTVPKGSEEYNRIIKNWNDMANAKLFNFEPTDVNASISEQFSYNVFAFNKNKQGTSMFDEFYNEWKNNIAANIQIQKTKKALTKRPLKDPRLGIEDMDAYTDVKNLEFGNQELQEKFLKSLSSDVEPFSLQTSNMKHMERLMQPGNLKHFTKEELYFSKRLIGWSNANLAFKERSLEVYNKLLRDAGLPELNTDLIQTYVKRVANPDAMVHLNRATNPDYARIMGKSIKGVDKIKLQTRIYDLSLFTSDINQLIQKSGLEAIDVDIFGEAPIVSYLAQLDLWREEVQLTLTIQELVDGFYAPTKTKARLAKGAFKESKKLAETQETITTNYQQKATRYLEKFKVESKAKAISLGRAKEGLKNTFNGFKKRIKKDVWNLKDSTKKIYLTKGKKVANQYEKLFGKGYAKVARGTKRVFFSDEVIASFKEAKVPEQFYKNNPLFNLKDYDNFHQRFFTNVLNNNKDFITDTPYFTNKVKEYFNEQLLLEKGQGLILGSKTSQGYTIVGEGAKGVKYDLFKIEKVGQDVVQEMKDFPENFALEYFYNEGIVVRKGKDGSLFLEGRVDKVVDDLSAKNKIIDQEIEIKEKQLQNAQQDSALDFLDETTDPQTPLGKLQQKNKVELQKAWNEVKKKQPKTIKETKAVSDFKANRTKARRTIGRLKTGHKKRGERIQRFGKAFFENLQEKGSQFNTNILKIEAPIGSKKPFDTKSLWESKDFSKDDKTTISFLQNLKDELIGIDTKITIVDQTLKETNTKLNKYWYEKNEKPLLDKIKTLKEGTSETKALPPTKSSAKTNAEIVRKENLIKSTDVIPTIENQIPKYWYKEFKNLEEKILKAKNVGSEIVEEAASNEDILEQMERVVAKHAETIKTKDVDKIKIKGEDKIKIEADYADEAKTEVIEEELFDDNFFAKEKLASWISNNARQEFSRKPGWIENQVELYFKNKDSIDFEGFNLVKKVVRKIDTNAINKLYIKRKDMLYDLFGDFYTRLDEGGDLIWEFDDLVEDIGKRLELIMSKSKQGELAREVINRKIKAFFVKVDKTTSAELKALKALGNAKQKMLPETGLEKTLSPSEAKVEIQKLNTQLTQTRIQKKLEKGKFEEQQDLLKRMRTVKDVETGGLSKVDGKEIPTTRSVRPKEMIEEINDYLVEIEKIEFFEKHLDPNSTFSKKFEKEIAKLLKSEKEKKAWVKLNALYDKAYERLDDSFQKEVQKLSKSLKDEINTLNKVKEVVAEEEASKLQVKFLEWIQGKQINELNEILYTQKDNPNFIFQKQLEAFLEKGNKKFINSFGRQTKNVKTKTTKYSEFLDDLKAKAVNENKLAKESNALNMKHLQAHEATKAEFYKYYSANGLPNKEMGEFLKAVEIAEKTPLLKRMSRFEFQEWQRIYGKNGFLDSPMGAQYTRVNVSALLKRQKDGLYLQGLLEGRIGSKVKSGFQDNIALQYLKELKKYSYDGGIYVHNSVAAQLKRYLDPDSVNKLLGDLLSAFSEDLIKLWKKVALFGIGPMVKSKITNTIRAGTELGIGPATYLKRSWKAGQLLSGIKKAFEAVPEQKGFWEELGKIKSNYLTTSSEFQEQSEKIFRKYAIEAGVKKGFKKEVMEGYYDKFKLYMEHKLIGNSVMQQDAVRTMQTLKDVYKKIKLSSTMDFGEKTLGRFEKLMALTLRGYGWTDEVGKIAIFEEVMANNVVFEEVAQKLWAKPISLDPAINPLARRQTLAGKAATFTLHNFSDLSHFERTILRNYFVFFIWPAKNVHQQLLSFVKNNKRHRVLWRLLTRWNENFATLGYQSYNPDQDGLPKWAQERGYIALPWKNNDKIGSYIQVSLPLLSAEQFMSGGVFATIHPVLKGMIQAASGIDLFKKSPLRDPTRVMGLGETVFSPFARKAGYLKDLGNKLLGGEEARSIEDILAGGVVRTRNLEELENQANREKIKRLLELRRQKQKERGFITEE